MKLYLSSYGLGDQPNLLVSLLGDNKKVLIINNAQDLYPVESTQERLLQNISLFKNLGLTAEELDLRLYFNKELALKEKILSAGLIWVRGGNCFVLRRAMRQSGLDKFLAELLNNNDIVYGGYSAGAMVVTPTLKGAELVDDPNSVPATYDKAIIWEGLGLVNFSIAPHYQSSHEESNKIDAVVKFFQDKKMPYKALRDGEVIIIKD